MIGLRFFPLKSADVRGVGKRDKPLRTSAWEASIAQEIEKMEIKTGGRKEAVNANKETRGKAKG